MWLDGIDGVIVAGTAETAREAIAMASALDANLVIATEKAEDLLVAIRHVGFTRIPMALILTGEQDAGFIMRNLGEFFIVVIVAVEGIEAHHTKVGC